jgi:hypothetical protein
LSSELTSTEHQRKKRGDKKGAKTYGVHGVQEALASESEKSPAGHTEQRVAFEWAWNIPATHSLQFVELLFP